MRTNTFYPKAALFQLQDGENSFLIDPLCIDDWACFNAVLANPAIPCILHSCSEDLELFQCFLGQLPATLLDTQVGAALIGLDAGMSYQNMVMEMLGVHVPKGETRSDWLQRPLTDSQKDYAALDVVYLPVIYQKIIDKLTELDRLDWWKAEGGRSLQNAQAKSFEQYYEKLKSAWKLDHEGQAILQNLCAWREQAARDKNTPRGWLVKDPVLFEIARRKPFNESELSRIQDIAANFARKYADTIFNIIEATQENDKAWPVPLPRPLDGQAKAQMKAARSALDKCSAQLGISSQVIANKKELEIITRAAEQDRAPELWTGWRQTDVMPSIWQAVKSVQPSPQNSAAIAE
jgi:ribonuclease D